MAASSRSIVLLILVVFVTHTAAGGLILRSPSSEVALPNDVVTFTCTLQTEGDYYIYVNEYPIDYTTADISDVSDTAGTTHNLSVTMAATQESNATSIQCGVDQGGLIELSSLAHLWIAARPLSPNPLVSLLNAGVLCISWKSPFTLVSSVGELNYTVKMFRPASRQWNVWTLPASPPDVPSCHETSLRPEETTRQCSDVFNLSATVSHEADLQRLFVIDPLSADFNCDEFIVYVSASNILGESESAGVEGTFAAALAQVMLGSSRNGTAASNVTLSVFWSLQPTSDSGANNVSVMLSDGQAATLPSATANYTFTGLVPDTCYNVSAAATRCSRRGPTSSIIQCTMANPPSGVSVSIIVRQESLLPIQLQVTWLYNQYSRNVIGYSVVINDATVGVPLRNYVIWPIRNASSYFAVRVSSVTEAGNGPDSQSVNVSGSIPSTDITTADRVSDSEVRCNFSSSLPYHCLVCCSTDPSVPPDSSVYNVSRSSGSGAIVFLSGLVAGHVYYCKVAATTAAKADCFSSVYRNIQTLIRITPGQIQTVQSPPVTIATTASISIVVALPMTIVTLIAIGSLIVSVIVRATLFKAKKRQFHNAKNQINEECPNKSLAVPGHVYEEVRSKEVPSSPKLGATYESVSSTGHINPDSTFAPHIYATLENRAKGDNTDSEEEPEENK